MGVRPSFSTSAILVRLIPVLHFPVLRLGPFNSSPAFSSPQNWLVLLIPVLLFQSPPYFNAYFNVLFILNVLRIMIYEPSSRRLCLGLNGETTGRYIGGYICRYTAYGSHYRLLRQIHKRITSLFRN